MQSRDANSLRLAVDDNFQYAVLATGWSYCEI